MNRLTRQAAIALAAAALVLTGCSSTDDDPKQEGVPAGFANGWVVDPDDSGSPSQGGTLQVVTYSEARSLDPAETIANGSSGGTEMAAVYDLLVRYDEASKEYVPQLAESIEANDDSTVWTLTLREGVTFSDGTPLDAAAVVWSLERYIANRGGQVSILDHAVDTFEATDDLTVTFTLANPWPGFPYLLATGPGMIVAQASDAKPDEFTPIGAGPFVFDHYSPQEELVLTARADYWGGAPNLEALRFFPLAVEQGRLDVLQSGEADVAYLREGVTALDAIEAGFGGFMEIGSISRGLLLNHSQDSATGDVRIRQAIAHAINPDLYNERTADGLAIMSSRIVTDLSEWDIETPGIEFDRDKAKELLDAAKADGYDGKISFKGVAKVSEKSGLAIKALLEDVGFTVSLDYVSSVSDLVADIYVKQDYDMVIWGFGMPDAAIYPELFEKVYSSSSSNIGKSNDPELDALILELGAADSAEDQTAALEKIQAQWNETVPYISLGATPEWNAWGDGVHGVVPSIDSIMLYGDAWKE
ncbi:ABC transporter substrate-binding protein [Nocardioides sp. AE5]|uniref:ABC transporter substrate-binding protein n=1 Tax=Nocardioides sp. AE5 TaxID=2962573 RepID=UPI002881E973|nr:ABC transporter substrate-binding protein [Nocardioides sp. AE5]MDT0202786.1 ABC transporter substrate-binding protein [Nocardioides sp. AE5]